MSLRGAASYGGIETTTEWKLIHALRQYIDRCSIPAGVAFSGGSTRTKELRNAINSLDIEIHKTFTIVRLDLLLYLESEAEDDASQASSDSEAESKTNEDSVHDDTYSQSSLESQPKSPINNRLDAPGDSTSPSTAEALSRLTRLCYVLEARVNPLLSPHKPGGIGHVSKFSRLTRLVEHLRHLSHSTTTLDLIPTSRTPPTRFLFNISEDEATAAAFVTLTESGQKRPPKDTRRRMLADVKNLSELLVSFNSFVDSLQISAGSLDTIATRPTEDLTSNDSFSPFALLHRFRRQTETACRAVLSHFGFCKHSEHKALLQLPGWDDVANCNTSDESAGQPIYLFFMTCSHGQWQPARMYFLEPGHSSNCIPRKLCQALRRSHMIDMDLEFYIPEDSKAAQGVEIPIYVPMTNESRIYRDGLPNCSLWTLIEQGRFAKEETIDLLYNTDSTGGILEIHQRKALAIKLVIGFMLSMDSDHVFKTWDPKHIHFSEPVETQKLFVSVPRRKKGDSSHQKYLSLSTWYPSSSLEGYEEDPKPLPQFSLLAKALLQIARGDRLSNFKIDKDSEQASWDAWKRLRRVVDLYSRRLACGPEVDRETLPLLHAALGCLNFHIDYPNRLRENRSGQKMEVAWKLVFDTILIKIDGNLTLKKLVIPGNDVLIQGEKAPERLDIACRTAQQSSVVSATPSYQKSLCTTIVGGGPTSQLSIRCVEPSKPNVELFDVKEGSTNSTANEFWNRLETFHGSYSGVVTHRNTVSDGDTPRRIRIAVIDTGIDFDHAGIMEAREEGRMKEEWCRSWVGADVKDEDDELHGTNCAYLLHKAAPEADIYIAKVFNRNALRFYEAENIAKAIEYAANTWDVDIISMSFGLRQPTARDSGDEAGEESTREEYCRIIDEIETAIRDASPRLIFAAASNSGKNDPRAFPANDVPYVICVHASEGNGEDGGINPEIRGDDFNFMTLGMGLELMERESFVKNGRTRSKLKGVVKSGTSFATPIAAGIAATVLDLASRVDAIDDRVERKLRRPEGMKEMLKLMSTQRGAPGGDRLCYMAPWHHWKPGWETSKIMSSWVWDTISLKVDEKII